MIGDWRYALLMLGVVTGWAAAILWIWKDVT